eukprot:970091-Rhodomonas_salina.1
MAQYVQVSNMQQHSSEYRTIGRVIMIFPSPWGVWFGGSRDYGGAWAIVFPPLAPCNPLVARSRLLQLTNSAVLDHNL